MTRKAAILGLGQSGSTWARQFHTAGWQVTGFDPDPLATGIPSFKHDWRREPTISATVRGADWIVICVPDRLELMRKVIQRAQAEAPEKAIIAVATQAYDIQEIQGCAVRPGCIISVNARPAGGFLVDVNANTTETARAEATSVLAELAAVEGFATRVEIDEQKPDAQSA